MDIKYYTIAEVSEILGVTKQCVYNKLNNLNELKPHLKIKNNTKYLSKEGLEVIKENLNFKHVELKHLNGLNDDSNVENVNLKILIENYESQIKDLKESVNTIKSIYEEQIVYLKNESMEKNEQLKNKDRLIENMQVLLKEQKMLTEAQLKKNWWQFWKKK